MLILLFMCFIEKEINFKEYYQVFKATILPVSYFQCLFPTLSVIVN